MYRVSFLIIAFTLLFTSCKSDDNDVVLEQEVVDSFYALKVGNTWTYRYFQVINGVFEDAGVTEGVEITQETTIGGNTYYTFETTMTGTCVVCPSEGVSTELIRDSLGYLINSFGRILYSSESNDAYLISEQQWGSIYGVLQADKEEINVEAGTFSAADNLKYAVDSNSGEAFPGMSNTYFSEGVGEVKQTYTTVSTNRLIFERQLFSFELN